MNNHQKTKNPQKTIQNYLDNLLREATEELAPVITNTPIATIEVAVVEVSQAVMVDVVVEPVVTVVEAVETIKPQINIELPAVKTQPVIKIQTPHQVPIAVAELPAVLAAPIVETQIVETQAPVAEEVVEIVDVIQQVEVPPPSIPAPTKPAWMESEFECLLFSVAGLQLAVPLVDLGGIHTIDSDLTALFGQPEWFLGLLPSQSNDKKNIRVVDTALWVMPERYNPALKKEYKYIILIEGTDWGLAVDSVAEAIKLKPGQVKWRTETSKRQWLAGTVIGQMCALLDIRAMGRLLNSPS